MLNAFKAFREERSQNAMLQNCLEFLINVCNYFFELARTSHCNIKAVELCSLKNNIKNFLEL